MSRFRVCLFVIINLIFLPAVSQVPSVYEQSYLITEPVFTDTLFMGGTLDGFNTFTKLFDVQLWPNKAVRVFEPMREVRITNLGTEMVRSPRLIFNDHGNWYDPVSMAQEAVRGSETAQDTILSLLYFVNRNRASYMLANIDSYYGLKMMTIYGYGACDLSSYNIRLLSMALGLNQNPLVMPHHVVSRTLIGNKGYHLDADFRVFYLKEDNQTIADISDILKDKHLIRRTKHFGANSSYNKTLDDYISRIYYDDPSLPPKTYNYGLFNNYYDFNLRPGESVSFSWDIPEFYHQDWLGYDTIPQSFLRNVIANGIFRYQSDFKNAGKEEVFSSSNHMEFIETDEFSGLAVRDQDSGRLVFDIKSPFPIHNLELEATFFRETENDSIVIMFSDENDEWQPFATINQAGSSRHTLNLKNLLSVSEYRQEMPFTYKGLIRMDFYSNGQNSTCGIDSLIVTRTFQISRFFIPSLKLGNNKIHYSDSGEGNERNILVNILWEESSDNNPPSPPGSPVFPVSGQEVDSLWFGFEWLPAIDPDGDEIVDYEFFLSGRPDMKFPHSPNFCLFVSSFGEDVKPYFKVKETGWLNDGEPYYWKVRAKDSRGAWGEWSPVWTFVPGGVMSPVNLQQHFQGDTIILTWRRNPGGKKPDYYKIYGSDETNGFSPHERNLIATASDTIFRIFYEGGPAPESFYRVTACTHDQQESGPSNCVSLPFPSVFILTDTLRINMSARIDVNVTRKYTPIFYYGEDTLVIRPEVIVDHPAWLKAASETTYTGVTSHDLLRKMIFDDALRQVTVLIRTDDMTDEYNLELIPELVNKPPVPALSHHIALAEEHFEAFIATTEEDNLYGDSHSYEVIGAPAWLFTSVSNDTLFISGNPSSGDIGNYPLEVHVTDSKGLTTLRTFEIRVVPSPEKIMSMFPNPILYNASALFKLSTNCHAELRIFSFSGEIQYFVERGYFHSGIHLIDLSTAGLSPGVYILKGIFTCDQTGKKTVETIKFVKH